MASTEELAFFDRVKKFIGNKQTYNEFLKLLNLFSQDLIGKDMLVDKVQNFIGGNKELMDWFKRFVGWEGKDEVVDNIPRSLNKVRLSVCRGLGPSYRLLPKLVCHCYLPVLGDIVELTINWVTRRHRNLVAGAMRCAGKFLMINGRRILPGHLKILGLWRIRRISTKIYFTVSKKSGMTMISTSKPTLELSNSWSQSRKGLQG